MNSTKSIHKMNKFISYFITILIFCSVPVSAQNINSYSRKKMFKFGICSPKNQSLNSTVGYYNRNNIEITTTLGLDFVMSPYSKENDSIKTITISSPDYFLKVIKVEYEITRQIDNVYLQKLVNDSVSEITCVYLDSLNNIDLNKSNVALKSYARFISNQKGFKFNLLVNKNNPLTLNLVNIFFRELQKINPSINTKLIIEQTINSKFIEGIYLKAIKQKK